MLISNTMVSPLFINKWRYRSTPSAYFSFLGSFAAHSEPRRSKLVYRNILPLLSRLLRAAIFE
jgi:hypothetical protein